MKKTKVILTTLLGLGGLILAGCGGSTPTSSEESSGDSTSSVAPVQFTVTWKDWDGSVLRVDTVNAGSMPFYGNTNPTRPDDDNYSYAFAYWSPKVVATTQNATYTAVYDSEPIFEINAEQFAEAVKFKDKNFTANVTYSSKNYSEELLYLETNEFYGTITENGDTTYRRLIDDGIDELSYYDGVSDYTHIKWTFQDGVSGDYDDVYDSDLAYDVDWNIPYVMENITSFDQLTYDSEHQYYTFSKDPWKLTITFYGNQLHKVTMEDGTNDLYVEFFDYGSTVLPEIDSDLAEYRAKQFADAGTLSAFAHNTDNYYDKSIEFLFAYSKVEKSTETIVDDKYYEVTMDESYREVYYQDGETIYGTYIQDVSDDTLYKRSEDEKYYPITDSSDPGYNGMDYSNPYNEGFGCEFLTGFFEFKNLVADGDVKNFEGYSVRRESAIFDIYSEHFETTVKFDVAFIYESGIDEWVVTEFQITFNNENYFYTYTGAVSTFIVDPMNPDIVD